MLRTIITYNVMFIYDECYCKWQCNHALNIVTRLFLFFFLLFFHILISWLLLPVLFPYYTLGYRRRRCRCCSFFGKSTGTIGRICNPISNGSGSCTSMCCGRGYTSTLQRRNMKCYCKFEWCCSIHCQLCSVEEWISVCKWTLHTKWNAKQLEWPFQLIAGW